jgi:N-acetylglucosaminyldiphosphoundecaprenol N-acetyl-beta-D-mannosaminyltransferase
MDFEKKNLFGIDFALVDYESASDVIIEKAVRKESFSVSALAVHGLVISVRSKEIGEKIRCIDMIVPDGQPIRWALNSLYDVGLKDRVYGPTLTLSVLKKVQREHLNVYLFGSTKKNLDRLAGYISQNFKGIHICGIHPDRFREATPEEDEKDIQTIIDSRAHIVLIGRGCPRQEIWVAEHQDKLDAVLLAVGAAFDFLAGTLKQAPTWMQERGLEWLFRLSQEPWRLWKRYLFTNSYFVYLWLKHKLFSRSM